MRSAFLTLTVLFLLASAGPATAQNRTQNRQCLHGPDETSTNRTRREKAVELAYEINGAEAMAGRLGPRKGRFVPFDQLFNVPLAPEGFRVQFHTDGTTYSFSIKDAMDPCFYAVFSDQSGDVYEGMPLPEKARVKLLSKK